MDFAELKTDFSFIEDQLVHRCLNNIASLDNPTSENLALDLGSSETGPARA
jgi:6-pyruvoyltetrahydropterin/6-carboxytetrahydropterin synthase